MLRKLLIKLSALSALILLFPRDRLRRPRGSVLPTERYDERDTMFARAARKPGTPEYEEYYARRPAWKTRDDRIRRMTPLCRPGARHYHPTLSRAAEEWFERIGSIEVDANCVSSAVESIRTADDPIDALTHVTRQLGAVDVGFTVVHEAFVYTHKGRLDKDYGRRIDDSLPRAVVFLVEMDHDRMQRAPEADTIRESARQYYRAARIAFYLEAILRTLGYRAKAHYDAHYDVILPPLAVGAGLGELGRNNILVADRYGSRVRIGAVTTDLPLPQSEPVDLGVQHFCAICGKCATNCPSRALSLGEKENVRGVKKWPTNVERCYRYWRSVGTDCGICMAVCPFSHKNNMFHNAVRRLIRLNPWMRHVALKGDDLVYGKTWKHSRR
ncbi:4Fe-4S dicluster domain-containing protein [bacterium]|nr:4Fe-4S dicluster domain-containing protein [bacterium]